MFAKNGPSGTRKAKASGVNGQKARQLAWRCIQGCQQPERPIDPDRLTDLIPRIVKHAGLPHVPCTTFAEHFARTWPRVEPTCWRRRSWRGTPAPR